MSEVAVQRRLTTAFINTQPLVVSLQPQNKVKLAAGGFAWQDAVPRFPQVMRLCFTAAGISEVPVSVAGQDGVSRKAEMMLLGEWDAEVAVNDTFEYEGRRWVVDQIYVSNLWETRAAVVRHD